MHIVPGDTIRELIETHYISESILAEKLNLSIEILERLLNGNLEITPDIAKRLEETFNIPQSFWLNLQKNYNAEKKNIK